MSYYDEEDSPRTRVFGTPLPQLARGEDAAKKADLDLTVRDDKVCDCIEFVTFRNLIRAL